MDADSRIEEVHVRGSVQTDFGFALVELAKAGQGIALLPDWSVHRELMEGSLVRLLPGYRVSHVDFENGVYAVFPASRQTSFKLRLFVDFLAHIFKRELGRN